MTQHPGFTKKHITQASYENLRQRVYSMKTARAWAIVIDVVLTESEMHHMILYLTPFHFLNTELSNYKKFIWKSGPYESLMY